MTTKDDNVDEALEEVKPHSPSNHPTPYITNANPFPPAPEQKAPQSSSLVCNRQNRWRGNIKVGDQRYTAIYRGFDWVGLVADRYVLVTFF